MNPACLALAAALMLAPAFAREPFSDETLKYSLNWPSGLSLGDAQAQASRSEGVWKFVFSLDADMPGIEAKDLYESKAAGDFCSAEFLRRSAHGKRKANEKTVFDPKTHIATRQTLDGGGTSSIEVPGCPRDALAFLYYLRRELADGRLPGPQTVYFGAPYQVRLEFGGVRTVRISDEPTETERVLVSFKGPASGSTFEMFFARDPARTPVLVKATLPAGSFTLELVR